MTTKRTTTKSSRSSAKAHGHSRAMTGSHRSSKSETKGTARGRSHGGKTTTDHDTIRHWAEERCGRPTTVKATTADHEPGLLRIDFPGYTGQDTLEEISWDDFFEKFDEKNLAMVYQEQTASGKPSRFCKLVDRQSAKAKGRARSGGRKR